MQMAIRALLLVYRTAKLPSTAAMLIIDGVSAWETPSNLSLCRERPRNNRDSSCNYLYPSDSTDSEKCFRKQWTGALLFRGEDYFKGAPELLEAITCCGTSGSTFTCYYHKTTK